MRLSILFTLIFCSLCVAQPAAKETIDPRTIVLVGDRFKPLKFDDMTPEQKAMVTHLLSGERGVVRGPMNVLLRSPEVGDFAQQFGGAMRFRTPIPQDVSQVVILMTGRYWMAQYEWVMHKAAALKEGVKPEIIDAIANGKRPTGMKPEMEIAYNFIDELLTTHQVTDATFAAVKDRYGIKGVFDMTGLSGWYCMVSMMLNTDRYPLDPGVQPELNSLDNPLPVVGKGFATPVPEPVDPKTVNSEANGKKFTISGDRFKPMPYEQMTPEQKKFTDVAIAGRGTGGSFNISLNDPDGGTIFFSLGERVRFHMSVPDKLKELAILLTARYWGSQYEWFVHHRAGLKAGLTEEKIQAIIDGKKPTGMSNDEELTYTFVTELYKTRQVTDATFAGLKNLVGERGIVDIAMSAAYYQAVSMYMNVDRLPVDAGQRAELKYIAKPLP